jgi:hypothetical protein
MLEEAMEIHLILKELERGEGGDDAADDARKRVDAMNQQRILLKRAIDEEKQREAQFLSNDPFAAELNKVLLYETASKLVSEYPDSFIAPPKLDGSGQQSAKAHAWKEHVVAMMQMGESLWRIAAAVRVSGLEHCPALAQRLSEEARADGGQLQRAARRRNSSRESHSRVSEDVRNRGRERVDSDQGCSQRKGKHHDQQQDWGGARTP